MACFDKYGVEFSDDRKTLIKCPEDFQGEYIVPEETTRIGNRAFQNCTRLAGIILSEKVIRIEDYAFWGCVMLKKIFIPQSVSSIGKCAFVGCSNVISVIVAQTNPVFDSRYNCNAIINTKVNKLIYGCSNAKIPNDIISIGESAFSNCFNMEIVTIPNSIVTIRGCAFSNCIGLKSVSIPKQVAYIGFGVFLGCKNLATISIPSSVERIQDNAFSECPSLRCIVVPKGEKKRFAAMDGMKNYTDKIVECEIKEEELYIDTIFDGEPDAYWKID